MTNLSEKLNNFKTLVEYDKRFAKEFNDSTKVVSYELVIQFIEEIIGLNNNICQCKNINSESNIKEIPFKDISEYLDSCFELYDKNKELFKNKQITIEQFKKMMVEEWNNKVNEGKYQKIKN